LVIKVDINSFVDIFFKYGIITLTKGDDIMVNYTNLANPINTNYRSKISKNTKDKRKYELCIQSLTKEKENFKQNFLDNADKLERYSTFKIEQISPFIADIIGLCCGEEYAYGILNYSFDSKMPNSKKIVLHPSNMNPLIDYSRKSKTFTIKCKNNEIRFYSAVVDLKSETCGLKIKADDILEQIPLLGTFIDMLIEKRMCDKLLNITNYDIKIVQYTFLTLYKDELKKQYMEAKKMQKRY